VKAHFQEIAYDQFTPITAFYALGKTGDCILESSPQQGRYSFVGLDPMARIEGTGDYGTALRKLRQKYRIEVDHPLALYMGGAIGYVTFEGDYFFQIYRSGVVFDHQTGRALLATIGDAKELTRLYEKLTQPIVLPPCQIERGEVSADLSDEAFADLVEKAKEHLRAGDVYQIVLSRTFQAEMRADPFQFYRALRKVNSAPYLFFFDLGDRAIVGASPEKVISVQGSQIESMPIAGTAPKGCESLLSDPKENAEHVMLVDLARNDVGAVSVPGSVKVADFKAVCEFPHVTHLVSRVVGTLDGSFDSLDALQASFPAGTLSGAPKVRAMELIAEMEGSPRGLYGGAIVALHANGDLSTCIAIRMAELKEGTMRVRAGAGIVLDSDPIKEAEETRLKASAILEVAHALNYR
jgi:anthranilate synthase component 1